MGLLQKLAFLVVLSCIAFTSAKVQADVIVTWENNANDLVIRWNGNISGWSPQFQFNSSFIALQTNNGLHALDGPVDLSWTGTAHNWYTGPDLNGILAGDSFGSSGVANWVYMPQNYAGQNISGSATFTGQGYLAATSFIEGSRDLGFGDNDNIIFRAASSATVTPEPTSLAAWGIGAAGLAIAARRRKMKSA